jgi:uncharacterized membrane protein
MYSRKMIVHCEMEVMMEGKVVLGCLEINAGFMIFFVSTIF